MIRVIPAALARELVCEGMVGYTTEDWEDFPLKFKYVEDKLVGKTRWSDVHEAVFQDLDSGIFYKTSYSVGSTECQDEQPFEFENEVEFTEVEPVEKVIIIYKEKQN
ncbi:hypothetical protein FBPa8_0035 [Pseudomonas phage vB_PaeP_FBPa8]|nr:hypothetical protein FBPa8_0035 [Pseudomonas phage vB_PaeP_FBPa8]